MKQRYINSSWNTRSSEYTLLHLLLRPNSVCSFIFTPLIALVMVNIAPSALFFLKDVLVLEKKAQTLCTGGCKPFGLAS
mgnify:CR=1 FL=1